MLVTDSADGQAFLNQATKFKEQFPDATAVICKVDGCSKSGGALNAAASADLAVSFIGTGEGMEDLLPFSARSYLDRLLDPIRMPAFSSLLPPMPPSPAIRDTFTLRDMFTKLDNAVWNARILSTIPGLSSHFHLNSNPNRQLMVVHRIQLSMTDKGK